MEITQKSIIGELVAENYQTAKVFKKHKIDFCCQGGRTVEDACKAKKLDAVEVVQHLNEIVRQRGDEVIDFKSWPMDLLVDYIEKKHHRYVEEQIPIIRPYLDKVARVHGDRHPELLEILGEFTAASAELTNHMWKEEHILFPFIRKMVESVRNSTSFEPPQFGTVENPIRMMMEEHDTEGERFKRIAELTENYTPPADACNTYRVSFALLKEFQEDLHLHIHLENNILFPAAANMEKRLQYQTASQ